MAYAGVYDPEMVGLMGVALDAAWAQVTPHPKDRDLARLFMASAILEKMEEGGSAADVLVETALLALQAALSSPLLQTALRREGAALRPPAADVKIFPTASREVRRRATRTSRRFMRGDRRGTTGRR